MGWRFEFEFCDKEITRDVIGATGQGKCWVEYNQEDGGWFVGPVTLEIDLGDLDTFEEEVSDEISDRITDRLERMETGRDSQGRPTFHWRDMKDEMVWQAVAEDRVMAAEAAADYRREG